MLFWPTDREVVPMEPAKLKSARPESEEAIRRLRDDLGAVRSCALLMAHAPAADVRSRYLRTLNKRIASMDERLARLARRTQLVS